MTEVQIPLKQIQKIVLVCVCVWGGGGGGEGGLPLFSLLLRGHYLPDWSRWRRRDELCEFVSVTSRTPIVPKLLSNKRPELEKPYMN